MAAGALVALGAVRGSAIPGTDIIDTTYRTTRAAGSVSWLSGNRAQVYVNVYDLVSGDGYAAGYRVRIDGVIRPGVRTSAIRGTVTASSRFDVNACQQKPDGTWRCADSWDNNMRGGR